MRTRPRAPWLLALCLAALPSSPARSAAPPPGGWYQHAYVATVRGEVNSALADLAQAEAGLAGTDRLLCLHDQALLNLGRGNVRAAEDFLARAVEQALRDGGPSSPAFLECTEVLARHLRTSCDEVLLLERMARLLEGRRGLKPLARLLRERRGERARFGLRYRSLRAADGPGTLGAFVRAVELVARPWRGLLPRGAVLPVPTGSLLGAYAAREPTLLALAGGTVPDLPRRRLLFEAIDRSQDERTWSSLAGIPDRVVGPWRLHGVGLDGYFARVGWLRWEDSVLVPHAADERLPPRNGPVTPRDYAALLGKDLPPSTVVALEVGPPAPAPESLDVWEVPVAATNATSRPVEVWTGAPLDYCHVELCDALRRPLALLKCHAGGPTGARTLRVLQPGERVIERPLEVMLRRWPGAEAPPAGTYHLRVLMALPRRLEPAASPQTAFTVTGERSEAPR